MYTMGIDPGLDGAIVFLKDKEVHAFDMPTLTYELKSGKDRREINIGRLSKILKLYPCDLCFMEALHGRPGSGLTEFTLGQAYGMTKAALALNGIAYKLASPPAWKKHHGLINKDKEASRRRASELFPGSKKLFSRKKDADRAEAVLIALYGLHVVGLNL